ncbi:MAG: tRNA (adenosine(37)-N6)-threonylcarbamoyltransferase complex ATPase subunit type 1 TsaE [Chloroflexota bacterium]
MIDKLSFISRSPEETRRLGARIGELALPGDIILLVGTLGAGKTCLTQGIARGLGITDQVMSPSFVLVRELHGRLPLYHIDLYRLEGMEEISDLGLDDYIYGCGLTVIEWAEKGLSLLPEEHLLIDLKYLSDNGRCLSFRAEGEHYREMISALQGFALTARDV